MRASDDLALANRWQRGFPLAPRPFELLGAEASLTANAALAAFRRLKTAGIVDRIGPVFRPNTVGASLLAAMAVPPPRLAAVARVVSAQPGVNHNYEREHRWNLWFVVTAPSEAEVDSILGRIGQATGLPLLRLPLVEEFHIDLGFDLDRHAVPRGAAAPARLAPLSAEERRLVGAVAPGLPLVAAPYARVAAELGLSEAAVIGMLERMLAEGRIRRLGAVIRHRRLGYRANAMAVWDVADAEVRAAGLALAREPAVTLCYRRARAAPEWPYNLYCMVHGRVRSRVAAEVRRISEAHGLGHCPQAVLFSRRCFAQRAARYG